jgi:hypothetical protein
MLQQDLYRQNGDVEETLMRASDTMKDANDTLPRGIKRFLNSLNFIFQDPF